MSGPATAPAFEPGPPPRRRRSRRSAWRAGVLIVLLAALAAGARWGHIEGLFRGFAKSSGVPVTPVRRGDVAFAINANGELRGGSPESLAAPMTGSGGVQIKFLRNDGDLVQAGDAVIEFDASDQLFRLREAEADLAEAEQQVLKAQAEAAAQKEEDAYALLKAQSDVRLAELEVRRNPLVSAITAKENELALASARDRFAELEQSLAHRAASGQAGVEIQLANRAKAEQAAENARRNIGNLTVRATREGYVSIRQNTNVSFYTEGMVLPPYRVGDRINPGRVVAEIPDLERWEVNASIGELDRGHLSSGQAVTIEVPALPFRAFHGRLKSIGGTTGMYWDRRFEVRISIEDPDPEMRPGMNVRLTIATGTMRDALWIPAQALFEADGRTFVYVPSGSGFAPRDVRLLRRSESQAVISGLSEGQVVALANPEESARKKNAPAQGAMKAIPK